MNIQQVVTKTSKPRTLADLLIVLSVLLTVLAALPYQLGDLATLIPPDWKPVIALTGIIASTLLGAIRPYLPSPNAPVPEPQPKTKDAH